MNLKFVTEDEIAISHGFENGRPCSRVDVALNEHQAKKIIDQMCEFFGEEHVAKMVKDELP